VALDELLRPLQGRRGGQALLLSDFQNSRDFTIKARANRASPAGRTAFSLASRPDRRAV
jgi:hypothetical protein